MLAPEASALAAAGPNMAYATIVDENVLLNGARSEKRRRRRLAGMVLLLTAASVALLHGALVMHSGWSTANVHIINDQGFYCAVQEQSEFCSATQTNCEGSCQGEWKHAVSAGNFHWFYQNRGGGGQDLPPLGNQELHVCPSWPEFCLSRAACVDEFHGGDHNAPVLQTMHDKYFYDCQRYCIECLCPGVSYCRMLADAIADPSEKMMLHVGTWPSHGLNHTGQELTSYGNCHWEGASIYTQQNKAYPACPFGWALFGMDEGGFCCFSSDGTGCIDGMEGDSTSDTICAVWNNPINPADLEQVAAPCDYGMEEQNCLTAYGLPTWTNVDFSMYFSYDGEHAGPIFNMQDPDEKTSPRYWLRFGRNFGLYNFDGTNLTRVDAGPKPIAHWSFDEDLTDEIGDLDFETMVGEAYVDPSEGALILDGQTIIHTNGVSQNGPVLLKTKTLAAWVQLETLDQTYGTSPFSVERTEPHCFDAIVFEERQSNTWMAGSSHFHRTEDFGGSGSTEYNAGIPVHIAMVYGSPESGDSDQNMIRIYRNGLEQGEYEKGNIVTYEANTWGVTMGARHASTVGTSPAWSCGGSLGCFQGKIFEATLYGSALSSAQVMAVYKQRELMEGERGKYPPGETYHVRIRATYEEEAWASVYTGGFCSYIGGEWLDKVTMGPKIIIQDVCSITVGDLSGTVSGDIVTLDTRPGTGELEGSKLYWDMGTFVEYADGQKCPQMSHIDVLTTCEAAATALGLSWYESDAYADGSGVPSGCSYNSDGVHFNSNINEHNLAHAGYSPICKQTEVWELQQGVGQRIQAWVNDELVIDIADQTISSGAVGFGTYHAWMQAYGVQIMDDQAEPIYGQIHGGITSNHLMDVYIDGTLYSEKVHPNTIEIVRMSEDYSKIAVQVEQSSFVNSAGDVDTHPTWFWQGPQAFSNTQLTFASEANVNKFDKFGFTVMVWVKPSGNSAALDWQRVIGKGDATNRNYGIWLLREHTLAQVYGSSAQNAIDSTSATPDDHWTHLTLRTREEDCSLCLFINGYESSCVAGCGDITPYSDADDLTMGYAGFHTYYAGEAKSAAIFDVPLLENQIATWAGQDYYEVSDLVYIDESMSYEAAAQYCRSNQRELATLYSASQEAYMRQLMGSSKVWIGYTDRAVEDKWEWDDTTKGESRYTNWWSGEPNNSGGEDCTEVYSHVDGWNDNKCTNTLPFVCGPEYKGMTEMGFAGALSSSRPDSLTAESHASNAIVTKQAVTYTSVSETAGCGAGSADADWDYAYNSDGMASNVCSQWCTQTGSGCVAYGVGTEDGSSTCRIFLQDGADAASNEGAVFVDSGSASAETVVEGDDTGWTCFAKDPTPTTGVWRCRTDEPPLDGNGHLWYDESYTATSNDGWLPATQGCDSLGKAGLPLDAQYIGLYSTMADHNSDIAQTGYLYCIFNKPAAAAADVTNLIQDGSFEAPVATSWQVAYSYSDASLMPPSWTVTSGSVDWGQYVANGHLSDHAAADGRQVLDLCGGGRGDMQQQVATTVGQAYMLSFAYNAHASCGGETKEMNVRVDGTALAILSKTRCGGWDSFAHCWDEVSYTLTATAEQTTISFDSVESSCGCMVIDDVKLVAV